MRVRKWPPAFVQDVASLPLLLLFSSTSTLSFIGCCEAFTPCAAPRFDEFSEVLVGQWRYLRDRNDDEGVGNLNECGSGGDGFVMTGDVEEVMRSCGGAVQGVRETDGRYLNRADDGFVYFPDGCYSSGPTSLEGGPAALSSAVTTTCICFGSTRFLFRTALGDSTPTGGLSSDRAPEAQVKVRWSDKPHDLAPPIVMKARRPPDERGIDATTHEPCLDFRAIREVQCRTPTPGQPWMLPRALWEQRDVSSPDETVGVGENRNEADPTAVTECTYWVDWSPCRSGGSSDRNEADQFHSTSPMDLDAVAVLRVGVEFQTNVKVLSRAYHPRGELERALWTEGFVDSMK